MPNSSCNCALGRRDLLALGAGALAAALIGSQVRAADAPATGDPIRSPELALVDLKDGNARFVSQPQLCEADLIKQRAALAGHQAPWATILSCADSRVPPELVFGGRGLGELFVARNAGNLADIATIGTL